MNTRIGAAEQGMMSYLQVLTFNALSNWCAIPFILYQIVLINIKKNSLHRVIKAIGTTNLISFIVIDVLKTTAAFTTIENDIIPCAIL